MTATSTGPAPRPLRSQLRRLLVGAAALLLIGTAATFAALFELEDDTKTLTDGISPARIAAVELTNAYVNQQTGIRGYTLTRDRAFLLPYRDGQLAETASADKIRAARGGDSQILANLDEVRLAAQAWRRDFADPAIALISNAGEGERLRLKEKLGKERFDAIRASVDALNETLKADRVQARERVGDEISRLRVLSAAALATVLLACALLWVSLRRLVLAPLDSLAGEARLVASGDFDRQVAAEGPAEIRRLGADVDAMRAQLALAVTSAQQAEREIRAQAYALETRTGQLATRTAELDEQAEDLRRSNSDLEQFAYVASHDLQEPLRKVASFCQMLQRRYSGQLDERADQYIEFAVDGSKRMQLLINDLLAFSRVGRSAAELTDVDCGEVAGHALAALSVARTKAKAKVEIGELPTVRGDDTLLTQLFQNLIGNAIKFRAPERAPTVRISAELAGEAWHFRCEDNGIGIDPEYADRVFVIFQRLHGKEAYPGTGIGLSLCKKIVEYHGGRIWLDAERTEGTMVHWTLPVPDTADANGVAPHRKATET